jgi:hypothetical protein
MSSPGIIHNVFKYFIEIERLFNPVAYKLH